MTELVPFISNDVLQSAGLECADIYQSADYVAVEAKKTNADAHLFIFQSALFNAAIPVLIKEVPYGEFAGKKYCDAASPYGYPGIITSRELSSDEINEFLSGVMACALRENIVSIFIRLHPFYNQFRIDKTQSIEQVVHGRTVYVDLQEPVAEIRSRYSTNHKRTIKKLHAAGFITQVNKWDDYDKFREAYRQTMLQAGASDYYFFDAAYFSHLKESLNDRLLLFSAYDHQQVYCGGALFTTCGNIAQYHLGGTMPAYRKHAPSKIIFDAAIEYFASVKMHFLHLGGGVGSAEDELFRFKQGFSKNTREFSTIRCITNLDIYNQLSEIHLQKTSTGRSNYFPLYRQPS